MQTKSLSNHGEFQQDDLARIISAVICDQPEPAAAELLDIGEAYGLTNEGMALLVCERIAHLDKVLRILAPEIARRVAVRGAR